MQYVCKQGSNRQRIADSQLRVLTATALAQASSLPILRQANLQVEVASIRPSNPDAPLGSIQATAGYDGYTAHLEPVRLMISLTRSELT